MILLEDNDIFPYGKYKNERKTMEEVPAWYLLKQYDSFKKQKVTTGSAVHQMMMYVEANRDVLEKENGTS